MEKTKTINKTAPTKSTHVVLGKEFITSYSLTEYKPQLKHLVKDNNFEQSLEYLGSYFELINNQELENTRLNWYETISGENFRPRFSSENGVSFFMSEKDIEKSQMPYKIIEELVGSHLRKAYETAETEEKKTDLIGLKESLLNACVQLLRYLPEFEKRKPKFFVDTRTAKLGVVFQKNGTLTLMIGDTSEIEYSYAQKQLAGTVRITGTAKLTKHIQNSKNIWKLLNFQGINE